MRSEKLFNVAIIIFLFFLSVAVDYMNLASTGERCNTRHFFGVEHFGFDELHDR